MNNYQKQANDFCTTHKVTITSTYQGHRKYFPDDATPRAVFEVTITRQGRKPHTFTFGQSIVDSYEGREAGKGLKRGRLPQGLPGLTPSVGTVQTVYTGRPRVAWHVRQATKPPTSYDILACVTKNDPGDFEDFCSEYGYNTDSKKDTDVYLAVVKEWKAIERIFGDCLDELQEIN